MFRMMPEDKIGPMKQIVEDAQKKCEAHVKELSEVRRQIDPPIKKARTAIQQKKIEEEKEKRRLEAIRLQERTKVKSQRASEIAMYSDFLIKVQFIYNKNCFCSSCLLLTESSNFILLILIDDWYGLPTCVA